MTAAFRLCVCVCLGTGAPAACICTAGGASRARGARRSPRGLGGRGCLQRESSYFEVWKLCPLACAAARLGKPFRDFPPVPTRGCPGRRRHPAPASARFCQTGKAVAWARVAVLRVMGLILPSRPRREGFTLRFFQAKKLCCRGQRTSRPLFLKCGALQGWAGVQRQPQRSSSLAPGRCLPSTASNTGPRPSESRPGAALKRSDVGLRATVLPRHCHPHHIFPMELVAGYYVAPPQ